MLEKVEELFFLASSQIAGSLIKINANQNPEILVFSHEVGGGGGVPAVMTSLWKFTSEI